jgi:hypothetical protein
MTMVATSAYAWLGLAMSGPFVLLLHRPQSSRPGESPPYSRAEVAWLLIGAYWIVAGLLLVPMRLPDASLALLATVSWLAAGLLWLLGARPAERPRGWTHRAAVIVLATWPLAWGAMILLTIVLLD